MGRLRKWVNDDREFLRTLRRLEENRGLEVKWGPRDLLLPTGRRLARPMASQGRARWSDLVQEYIRASLCACRSISAASSYVLPPVWSCSLAPGAAVLASVSSYNKWIETRPWAYLVRLSTSQTYPLAQELALTGAPRQI
jgi:hypothetical protein